LQNKPTIYDLPIASAFGIFSALVQDSFEPHEDNTIFHLKKRVYNNMNGKSEIFESKKQHRQIKDKFYIEDIFNTQKNIPRVATGLKNIRASIIKDFSNDNKIDTINKQNNLYVNKDCHQVTDIHEKQDTKDLEGFNNSITISSD
ncbi:17855_t:CDS:2, partial [Racocetra fulgida]